MRKFLCVVAVAGVALAPVGARAETFDAIVAGGILGGFAGAVYNSGLAATTATVGSAVASGVSSVAAVVPAAAAGVASAVAATSSPVLAGVALGGAAGYLLYSMTH